MHCEQMQAYNGQTRVLSYKSMF